MRVISTYMLNLLLLAFGMITSVLDVDVQTSETLFQGNFPKEKILEIDTYLDQVQAEIGMPSIAMAVIQNGKVVYRRERGLVNVEHDVTISNRSIFPLYSLTKPFIAVGVFALIEKGELSLEDSITKFIYDVPPDWNSVQVKHLLTHSSGLPDMVGGNPYELRDLNREEAIKRVYSLPKTNTEGSKYAYNQTNFWLLKEIIEKVTSQSLSDFIIQKQFLDSDTKNVFFSEDARDIIKNRVTPYFPWLKGKMAIDLNYANGDYFYACNGFHLTLDEFIKWDLKLKDSALISRSTMKEMWQQFDYANDEKSFTYGWEATAIDGQTGYGFSGAMTTFYRTYPESDMSIIFLSNGFSKMYSQDRLADTLVSMILE